MKKIVALSFSGFCLLIGMGCFIDPSSDTKKAKDIKFMSYSSLPASRNGNSSNYVYPPNFSLFSGSYSIDIIVEINTATVGAIIHYTMNGDDPTESSPIYLNPIAISGNGTIVTIKAIAIIPNGRISPISTATYQINWLKCSVPNFNPPSGSFTGTQTISITSDAGAIIKYTTDGSDPKTSSSSIMGSTVNVNYCMTVRTYAYAPGKLDSDTSTANFSIVQDLGYVSQNDVDIVRICSGPDNKPIILCRENYQTCAPLYNYYQYNRVYKWDSGTTWDDLGYFTGISDNSTHIAVGSDNIPVVFIKDTNDNDRGRVMKWNAGTTWTDLGHVSVNAADNLSIVLGSDNKPIVAFCDFNNSWRVHVMKWDSGTSWIDFGFVSAWWENDFNIVCGADNKPVIIVRDNLPPHVLKWVSGTQWSDLSFTGGYLYSSSNIAICKDNLPIVMYYDSPHSNKLYVVKYNSSGLWADLRFPDNPNAVFISSDKYCNPIGAYSTSEGLQLMKWDSGTTWQNEGVALFDNYNYAMCLGADGLPIIAYIEGYSWSGWLRVKKFIIR